MDLALEEIVRFLNAKEIRATYGAVAEVLGVVPRSVNSSLLGSPRQEVSWIVNAGTGLPTGYADADLHPALRKNGEVIRTGTELRERIQAYRNRGHEPAADGRARS